MLKVQNWIIDNLPVKVQKRTKDTLLKCKCPICGDYQKKDRKNRERAAFIVKDSDIHYNCFNDSRCSGSLTFNKLAFITCRFKNISLDSAKTLISDLVTEFIDLPEREEKNRVKVDIKPVEVPGDNIDVNGLRWLMKRGIEDINIIRRMTQKWNTLYYPLTYRGEVFGYKEIGIKKKWYKTVTGDNDINNMLVGIDDIKDHTKLLVVVESIIDALLITQDSGGMIVGLAMDGAVLNDDRLNLLESTGIEFIVNPDGDETGLKLINRLRLDNPDILGVVFSEKYKDYGKYREFYGAIASLAYITQNKCEISSPMIELMGVIND